MAQNMGLGPMRNACPKNKNRWLLKIDGVTQGVNALVPSKSARPNLSFKEMEVQHVVETVYFPSKPDWKPINLVLYDIQTGGTHPVIKWFQTLYNVSQQDAQWLHSDKFKKNATLELYDGCGKVLEKWTYENAWPNTIEFGELDMQSSEIVMVDLTLRYDRAYQVNAGGGGGGGGGGIAASQSFINSQINGVSGIA